MKGQSLLLAAALALPALTAAGQDQVPPPPAYPDGMCKAGDLVAVESPNHDGYLMAVVVQVDPQKHPFLPCLVHPIGYPDNAAWPNKPADLAIFFAATLPAGNNLPDPYFEAFTEQVRQRLSATVNAQVRQQLPKLDADPQPQLVQAQAPASGGRSPIPGLYECYALTSGHLSPRLALNLTIVDGQTYRDFQGGAGRYTIDGSGTMTFVGAALSGQRARYSQPSTPPTRNRPPNVTYVVSGDSCDLKM